MLLMISAINNFIREIRAARAKGAKTCELVEQAKNDRKHSKEATKDRNDVLTELESMVAKDVRISMNLKKNVTGLIHMIKVRDVKICDLVEKDVNDHKEIKKLTEERNYCLQWSANKDHQNQRLNQQSKERRERGNMRTRIDRFCMCCRSGRIYSPLRREPQAQERKSPAQVSSRPPGSLHR